MNNVQDQYSLAIVGQGGLNSEHRGHEFKRNELESGHRGHESGTWWTWIGTPRAWIHMLYENLTYNFWIYENIFVMKGS